MNELCERLATRWRASVVRLHGSRYEVWRGEWAPLADKEAILTGAGWNAESREVEGLAAALRALGLEGRFLLLDPTGRWDLAAPGLGKYSKTVFPRRDMRLW